MLGKVFKAYDVRATVPEPLDERIAWQIGHGAARMLLQEAAEAGFDDQMMRTLAVGRDPRATSPGLKEALCTGIRAQGASVVDLGVVDTPMVNFAVNHLDCAGGIQVTASHNPAEYNGFKFFRRGGGPVGTGSGLEEIRSNAALAEEGGGTDNGGLLEERDLWDAYARLMHDRLALELPEGIASVRGRPLHVVIDASNGSAGVMVPRLFEGIEDLRITGLNFETGHGTFVHDPNPLVESNLDQLRAAVVNEGADAGICFDGDADRCVVLDESGRTIGGDLLTALLVEPILQREPGGSIVHDARASRIVPERIAELGGNPVPCRVGHVFMKSAIVEHGALFGGELSGHFYYKDMFNADSGSRAFLSVLGVLGRTNEPVSRLVEPLRKYAQSGEINFRTEDTVASIEQVRDHCADADLGDFDGLLVDAGSWWANIRASNTEPLLRLNVESTEQSIVDEVVTELGPLLGDRVKG